MKSLVFFFTVFLFITISNARRFEVGGSGAWVSNPAENYQSWAQKSRFQVHDTLYFNYAKGADSVLEVNKADFEGCNTKNPIKKMDDGESEISLDRSGPFYFISGNEDNCKKGQKLSVVVLSSRSTSTAPPPQASAPGILPSPSPGAHSPKSSSPPTSSAPVTSPPGSMAPKSSSPVSPPAPQPPNSSPSSSPVSPVTSPPAPQPPISSISASPSSAPGTSPPGSMAPVGSPSSTSANSPSMAESPPSPAPSGSDISPSGDAPSTSGDITTPSEAPGQSKSSANGIVAMSVTTVLGLVLTLFLSV